MKKPFALIILLHAMFVAFNSNVYAEGISEGIHQSWLNSLLSIEVINDHGKAKPIGSGFLLLTPNNHVALITAKHVIIDDSGKILEKLAFRINDNKDKSHLISDQHMSKKVGPWFLSKDHDIACRLISWTKSSKFSVSNYGQLLKKDKIKPAAPLLIPGYPLGLRSEHQANPIVRRGIVARVDSNNIII